MSCEKCHGKGFYNYDESHSQPCEVCCKHSNGFWKLEKHYGKDNNKFACRNGCGFVKDKNE